jgi:dihydrofolate reductase
MYETMAVWETLDDEHEVMRDYAEIWRAADKVVYSRTLSEVTTSRTRLEREFDPEAVRRMKSESERDISVGGPGLAAAALRAGVVDEVQLFLHPLTVGAGKPALPGGVRLELLDERRFASGVVYLRYAVT